MIYYLIGVALFIFMLEQLVPGWKLPKVSTWVARVIFLNIVQVSIALLAGITWNKWMMGHSLLHTSDALPPLLAGFAAYFVNTFVTYWWHRARHANDTLWRLFHQLHHAPQRIEVFTSFYKHPTEMVFNSLLGSFVAYVVMGISIEAGAYYIMFAALGEMFYHSNLRTPHVLGYLFQRPEMHRIHHQRDRHECNYSDFPIWDMLFGTYEKPPPHRRAAGLRRRQGAAVRRHAAVPRRAQPPRKNPARSRPGQARRQVNAMIPDIDSRLSRNILKSISYGLPLAEVVPDHTYAQLETRLGELKRRYLELRISHGARELPFSNYLFYLILQSRHQEFDFKLRQGNSVVTNIHRFKSKGRIPSLTTLLLADAVNAKSELELKHPDIPQLDRHARDIERWLAAGNVMPPSERALRGLVEALERAAGEGRPLHLVSAVCPDYSHSSDAEGKPRYTFERVGDQPGLAGAKLVSAGQAVAELARARQVEIRHAILGGEFEYLSFNRNPATGETREGFLGKVERQLERIAGALPCPAATCSFFEMCGGEDGWHRAHGEIVQRLEQGDYGQTGLDYPALESIFLSRLPLYEKWFASQSREQIWASFVSQAAEYALMGKLFGERFDNFVVLAVDHYRMEPFYSFFATVPTLYIRTDYL